MNCKDPFLTTQLVSYIGNKRRLLGFINSALEPVLRELDGNRLRFFDGFSGTGCVARLFKTYASELHVNDMEPYSNTLNQCYLANASEVDISAIHAEIDSLNANKLKPRERGFIERNYAPLDDRNIQLGERVFYTTKNARIIDNIRSMIRDGCENVSSKNWMRPFLIAPLLVAASIHTNTSGIFRGFHKNKRGIGHFGGEKEVSVERIVRDISLKYPILGQYECEVAYHCGDTNEVIKTCPEFDITYYDPPYNQHAYGANYFMLNVIDQYNDPTLIEDSVTGIVADWQRSAYNKRHAAEAAFEELISNTPSKYILVSYNDEGIIATNRLRTILEKFGTVNVNEQPYATFGGCRNMGKNKKLKDGTEKNRTVKERLWTLKKR